MPYANLQLNPVEQVVHPFRYADDAAMMYSTIIRL